MHRHALGQYPAEVWHQTHYPFGSYGQEGGWSTYAGSRDFWMGMAIGGFFTLLFGKGVMQQGISIGDTRARLGSRRKTSRKST